MVIMAWRLFNCGRIWDDSYNDVEIPKETLPRNGAWNIPYTRYNTQYSKICTMSNAPSKRTVKRNSRGNDLNDRISFGIRNFSKS